jgi:hypothetical protein
MPRQVREVHPTRVVKILRNGDSSFVWIGERVEYEPPRDRNGFTLLDEYHPPAEDEIPDTAEEFEWAPDAEAYAFDLGDRLKLDVIHL